MFIDVKFISRHAILLAAVCMLHTASWADDITDNITDNITNKAHIAVDAAIHPLMAENDVPGMAIAVSINGQSLFFNYGVASIESQTPVSENTLFEIGSISKTFTATLGLYAQQLGKLSLNDHPGKFMPELQTSPINRATLLNLATYTAGGLPPQFPDAVTPEQMQSYFQQLKLQAVPGTQRRYSNPSIGLFGHIAALALESDFAEAMQARIFSPLGLQRSYILVPESELVNYAWGYNKTNKPIRVDLGVLGAEAYGIKSNAADMIRYIQINIDPSQLDAPLRQAILGTHTGYFKVGHMVQGPGWEQYPFPATLEQLLSGNSADMVNQSNTVQRINPTRARPHATLYNKTGSTNGFGAYVLFVPDQKIGIVMLANKNYPIPARIKAAHAILEQLIPLTRKEV